MPTGAPARNHRAPAGYMRWYSPVAPCRTRMQPLVAVATVVCVYRNGAHDTRDIRREGDTRNPAKKPVQTAEPGVQKRRSDAYEKVPHTHRHSVLSTMTNERGYNTVPRTKRHRVLGSGCTGHVCIDHAPALCVDAPRHRSANRTICGSRTFF